MLADGQERDVLVGDVRKRGQSLPAAPAGRFRVSGADDVSNPRMQAIGTDQHISLGCAPVFELDPYPIVRTDHLDRTGVVSDAIGRKALKQTLKQDSTRNHPNGRAQPVHDRGQVQRDERASRGCHDPHGGQQLTGSVHINAQLFENRRAVGPDGDGAATCLRIRPLFVDGDVMSVPQQSPSNGNAAHAGADDEDP